MKRAALKINLLAALLMGIVVIPSAYAADQSKVIHLEGEAEFYVSIDDYQSTNPFLIKAEDDVTTAGSVVGDDNDWSIWTNSTVPVNMKFLIGQDYAAPDGSAFMKHVTAIDSPAGEHQLKFSLIMTECGNGEKHYIGSTNGVRFGSPFPIDHSKNTKQNCENNPGMLEIQNEGMAYRPYLGKFAASVTVIVSDPGSSLGLVLAN